MTTERRSETPERTRWLAFALVCGAYLATTTGEALLAPTYPIAADELGLDLTGAGLAFALLAGSIAVANVVGGLALRRLAANHVLAIALATTAVGTGAAAVSNGAPGFLAAQVLIGAGAGLLYPAAIMSVGAFAGPHRRGLAMGLFGVAFSGGLILAAGLSALGTEVDWRWAFAVAAGLASASALTMLRLRGAPRGESTGPVFAGLGAVLGIPTLVGVVGGISQYATVSFLPAFSVEVWGSSEAVAAGVLAVGRILSVPAKLISGAAADRFGPIWAARTAGFVMTASGLLWVLSPWTLLGGFGAVVFTAEVSALFPLANLLALDRVGRRGPALGAFRSLQLGAGAAAGVVLGAAADAVGLRPSLTAVVALPALLGLLSTGSQR